MIRISVIFLYLVFLCGPLYSQSGFQLINSKNSKINFQLIDNLIIIPVEINGIPMSFILDTGVSRPILFNISNPADQLKFKTADTVYLKGLGDGGYVEALKSENNLFKIGKAVNTNQEVIIISDPTINFTPRLGIPVHGIIGYDIFKNFVVDINYGSHFIRLHNPKAFRKRNCKNCETLPLIFYNNKPYLNAVVEANGKVIPVRLLIDSGGSDALWLFENEVLGLVPENDTYFVDFLGKGLSGNVHGKRSKLKKLILGDFFLTDVNVAHPDSLSVSFAKKYKNRQGTMGGELLKRFNLVMDYEDGWVMLKRNRYFKTPFEYNKSGIILEQKGLRQVAEFEENETSGHLKTDNNLPKPTIAGAYKLSLKPAFAIVELRPGSPAEGAGLKVNDIILAVNNKNVNNLKLQTVSSFFRAEEGKSIKVKVDRDGTILIFYFKLKNLL